ncbi:MAG TPA: DNA (cytosine-5-)-methyltransferase [Runella sp.]|nr:DNA (cytosine-5-)-methyltransferase [Runella sp.]
MTTKSIKVIDLFCGIGGLSHGFVQEKGFDVVAGFDIDEACRFPYEENNKATFFTKDVREVKSEQLNELFKGADVKVLVGCAPCQPFSTYAFKSPDKAKAEDEAKWSLLGEFARLIEEVLPEIVSMENVPGLAKFDKSHVFKEFLGVLYKHNYFVDYQEIYCPDYGIPQQRKRLVLLASRLSPIKIMDKTHGPNNYKTVKDAIGDLEPIESGEASPNDPIHRAAKLSDKNLQRIRQSKQGGTWRDWSEDLVLECHRKKTGKTYASVYGRMQWNKPAPTMTTFCTGIGNGRFGHPEQDRAISLREAAMLQTFPRNYKFVPEGKTPSMTHLSTHIGNAVPVELGRVVAKSIKFHLYNNKKF